MFGYYLTPTKVLELLKQVDGSGSNLDADSLQGNVPSDFAASAHDHTNATPTIPGFQSATDKTKLDGIAASANNYSHPVTDGNLHVSATGTTNNLKVLKAGATAGSFNWSFVNWSEIVNKPSGNDALVSGLEAEAIMSQAIADASLNSLWDVMITSPVTNTYLKHDGTNWVNAPAPVISVAGKTGAVTLAKADVGLSNVQNIDQTNASNLASGTVPFARIPTLNQNTTGNAATANKWTTARNLTIGNTAKAVDGSGNVSWSLAEINPNIPLTNVPNTYGATQTISRASFAGIQLETTSAPLDQKNWLISLGNSSSNSFSIQERSDSNAFVTNRLTIYRGTGAGVLIDSNQVWHSGNLIVESGIWTPELRTVQDATSAPASVAKGNYIQIGGKVDFALEIITTGVLPSSANQVAVTLPFVVSPDYFFRINVFQMTNFNIDSGSWITAACRANQVRFYTQNLLMSTTILQASQMVGNCVCRVNGTFLL